MPFNYDLTDLTDAKSLVDAQINNQTNSTGAIRTTASQVVNPQQSLTTYGVGSALQGVALYKPQGVTYDAFNNHLSRELENLGTEARWKTRDSKLLPYDVFLADIDPRTAAAEVAPGGASAIGAAVGNTSAATGPPVTQVVDGSNSSFEADFDQIILSPSNGKDPGNKVVALIFHDMEAPESPGRAEQCAQFFANPNTQASTHGCIDNQKLVGCVPYGVSAWHTGAGSPWNGMTEGYEHAGYANQSREQWMDEYGLAMMEISAKHFAKRCKALGIPPRRITPAQLNEAIQSKDPSKGGICGHGDITAAKPVPGGHTDPGPNFPWDYYIGRVQAHHGP